MKVPQAVDACLEYHQANSEKNTAITYRFVLGRFRKEFEKARVDKLTSEDIFSFLAAFTEGKKQSTKYTWCAVPRAFFNHIIYRYQFSF